MENSKIVVAAALAALLLSSGIVDAVAPVNSTAAAYNSPTADTSMMVVAVGDPGTETGRVPMLAVAVPSFLVGFMPEVAGPDDRGDGVSILQDPSRLVRSPFDAEFSPCIQHGHRNISSTEGFYKAS